MFVVDDHIINSSLQVSPLVQEVVQHFPTLTIRLSSFRYELIKTNFSSSLQNPRKMTLFILFLSGQPNETEIQVVTVGKQLKSLSWGNPHPKCLINLLPPKTSLSVKKMLQNFWKNDDYGCRIHFSTFCIY